MSFRGSYGKDSGRRKNMFLKLSEFSSKQLECVIVSMTFATIFEQLITLKRHKNLENVNGLDICGPKSGSLKYR